MKTEALIFTLLMVIWPIFLFWLISIRPKQLFRKYLCNRTIQSLKSIGINQVFNSGSEYRFKGIYKKHTIGLTAKKNTAIKAYISVSVTFRVESTVEEHFIRINPLNNRLIKLPIIDDSTSKWVADELIIGWELPFNAINYNDLKNKLDQTIDLVNENNFQALGSLNTKTKFKFDWDKEMN